MNFIIIFLCSGCVVIGEAVDKLNVFHEWKFVDFLWENSQHKSQAVDSGDYDAKSCFPFDTDQSPDGRIFVTLVKDAGVPATLTTVSSKNGEGGPLLKPYPSWSWNQKNDCKGLIGVYRITVVHNRLYVLDTGKSGETQVCPPKLVIFDLNNDRVIKSVEIPSKYATNKNGTGLLVTPVVDIVGRGVEMVYMADTEGYGLVTWDGRNFRRLESKEFTPDPSAEHFTIGDHSFDLADGILGMAITPDEPDFSKRRLYFRPLASLYMYNVKLGSLFKKNQSDIRYSKKPNKMRSQSAAQAFSRNGVLFFSSLTDRSLVCWNRHTPFNEENTVQFAINEETLQFPSGVKIVPSRYDDKLLVMTNRYQKIANNDVDFTDINFRIVGGFVGNLIKGTKCESYGRNKHLMR